VPKRDADEAAEVDQADVLFPTGEQARPLSRLKGIDLASPPIRGTLFPRGGRWCHFLLKLSQSIPSMECLA
jgi:hypothetical protein